MTMEIGVVFASLFGFLGLLLATPLTVCGLVLCWLNIIIIRNAGFRLDAGKIAQRLFGKLGSAGGHKNAARVGIPVSVLLDKTEILSKISEFVTDKIKQR